MEGNIHIQTILKQGKTIFTKGYFTPPFKLANITEDKQAKALHLMMMSSSPGVLDGDNLSIKVELGEDTGLQLHTQSYQRIFTMQGRAIQNMEVHLAKNASFIYLPHPVVPHVNADFLAANKVFLSDGCSLIWGEILTCGRKLNGEIFKFTRLQNLTEIYLNNKLVIKENLCIKPLETDVNAIGQLEGFTHQASLICINQNTETGTLQKEVIEYLLQHQNIVFGVTEAPVKGIIVRLLSHGGEQLHECLKAIAAMAQNDETITANGC